MLNLISCYWVAWECYITFDHSYWATVQTRFLKIIFKNNYPLELYYLHNILVNMIITCSHNNPIIGLQHLKQFWRLWIILPLCWNIYCDILSLKSQDFPMEPFCPHTKQQSATFSTGTFSQSAVHTPSMHPSIHQFS